MSDLESSEARRGDEKLPPESWQLIFNRLNEEDLKTVSLVWKNFLAYSDLIKESLYVIHPNINMLSQLLKQFTQLKTVNLTRFQGIEAILKSFKIIRKLILKGYQNSTIIKPDSDLLEVGLKGLKLATSCIDDEGLAAIAKKYPQLQSVKLDKCKKVTTEGIKQMVKDIGTLRRLKVKNCDLVDYGDLLECMLSTGNLACLKKLCLGKGISLRNRETNSCTMVACL
ncbi:F-box/LRR-repeat protein [Corchorus olitorius]|uniref:F-box/LRR-repeat protein n=1 Tax=Corchorus olitorius TaxID=93759 RepID=A0A1R3KQ67_9ROSI|nr:F-box/LRR-repeat protein [Corchorus olitorius]